MRTFIAIEVGAEVRRTLSTLVASLSDRVPGVKWSAPENIHVTLRFLGELPDHLIAEVASAARAAALDIHPFTLGHRACRPGAVLDCHVRIRGRKHSGDRFGGAPALIEHCQNQVFLLTWSERSVLHGQGRGRHLRPGAPRRV